MNKTKRRALYIIAALLGALFILACLAGFAACGNGEKEPEPEPEPTPAVATVSSVSVTSDKTSIAEGEAATVTAKVTMSDGSDYTGSYTWSSNSYVEVSGSGASVTVTGKTAGAATVSVAVADSKSGSCSITVTSTTTEPETPSEPATVTGVSLSNVNVAYKETATATATVTMSSGTYSGSYAWESSDTSVATVSSETTTTNSVTVTGVKCGTTTITVSVGEGDNVKTASCTVTVSEDHAAAEAGRITGSADFTDAQKAQLVVDEVTYTDSSVTVTYDSDEKTYTIDGLSALMSADQAKALFDETHEGCPYIAFIINLNDGETASFKACNGETVSKTWTNRTSENDNSFVIDLTDHTAGDFRMEIDVTYAGGDEETYKVVLGDISIGVSDEAELRSAITIDNATVKLADDISLTTGCLTFKNSVTLDLNGKTLDVDSDATGYGADRLLDFELDNIFEVTEEDPVSITITSSAETMGKLDVGSLLYGFVIFGSTDSSKSGQKLAKISMSNVNLVAGESGAAYAISTNGTKKYGMDTIEIENCKISCKSYVAIYVPALDFKITDSTICGKTGIEIRGGSLEIANCTIAGTGDASVDWEGDIHNGAISKGYAISMTHPGGQSNYADITSVSVKDSTLYGSVYYEYDSAESLLSLEGVTIVVSTETQLRWAITVDGATVVLGDDITLKGDGLADGATDGRLDICNSLTLDLNGKTLSVDESAATTLNKWDRVLNFNLNNLTGITEENPIEIVITDTSSEGGGTINVGTLSYGFVIMGSQNSSLDGSKLAKITISNVNLIAGESNAAYAISTNGLYKYGMDTIEIENCKISCKKYVAIYIPALDFEIKDSTVAGVTGIEIRGGSLKVSDSLVIGTGDENVDWEGDIQNGAISTGYSISMTNPSTASNYADITSVEITGCTLLGDVYGDKDSEDSVLSIDETTTIYTCDDDEDEDDSDTASDDGDGNGGNDGGNTGDDTGTGNDGQ